MMSGKTIVKTSSVGLSLSTFAVGLSLSTLAVGLGVSILAVGSGTLRGFSICYNFLIFAERDPERSGTK